MSNICLKLLLEHSQNFDFLGLKTLLPGQFWGDPTRTDTIVFQIFLLQLKNSTSGSKTLCGFSIILIFKRVSML